MTIAQMILQVLAANGVRHLFGIPGDAINDVTDAVRRQEEISFIQVRHEEAGAFAASAQAKLTGQLAACVGTAGPGAIHLLNGLYDAQLDHAPVLAITGQVQTEFIGTQQHQEVHLERLFADVAVYSQTIINAEQAPLVIMEACRAAIAHRGVAHVSLPTNVAGRQVELPPSLPRVVSMVGRIVPDLNDCGQAVEQINRAQRVAILAGIGCAGARDELIAFAETVKAPIIRTLKAKEVLDDQHPLCIGGLGLLGGRPAVKAMDDCDLLVMVGSDFPYRDFYPKSARIIQIDNEATRIGKRTQVDIGLVGNAGPTLAALTQRIDQPRSDDFLQARLKDKEKMLEHQQRLETSDARPLAPPRVLSTLAELAPEDAVFTCDTGTVTAWSARHLRLKPGQRYILSGNLASMAFALPGALGAQLTYPERKVFALTGDGAFTMLMGDFVTAVKYALPIVVIVLNNGRLGFIKLEQEVKGLPEWGTELTNPDFAEFARACGGVGFKVERPEDLVPAMEKAIATGKPAVIDIVVDPDALIMPPEIKLSQAVGFTLSKLRELFGHD